MGDVDLVILDLLMPEMDGFEVVAELAAHERTAHIPILILTAHDLSEAEKQRLNGQITGVVAKQQPDLADALRSWLARVVPDRGSPTA